MKRVLAVFAAVGMVVAAVLVRGVIDDDADGDARDGDSSGLRLLCSIELREVCEQLAGGSKDVKWRAEAPGETADALADLREGADPGFDVWLTDASWPGIVADNRRFGDVPGSVLDDATEPLGRSPVVLMVSERAHTRLQPTCGSDITWSCVGDAAGPQLRVGLPAPDRGGLSVLASAVADRLDGTTYAVQDFDTEGFSTWFDGLTTSGGRNLGGRTPLTVAAVEPGRFDVVGAREQEVAALPRSRERYEPIYPDIVVTSDVVLVPAAGKDAAGALGRLGADRLATALAAQGWRVEGREPLDGIDPTVPLAPTSGMPAPGVAQNLRERW